MDYLIQTKRFDMRAFVMEDAPALFEMESNPLVHTYLGNNPLTKLEQVEAGIEYIQKQYQENGFGRLAIFERETGEFVGWSGLKREKEIRAFHYNDLGYRLKPNFWGKGIATETCIASLRFGFEKLGMETICAGAMSTNMASNRVLIKCGLDLVEDFVFENEPCHFYRIEQSEWFSRGL